MKAEATILYKCDLTRIPADAVIIKIEIKSSFHFISRIEKHQREYVTYVIPPIREELLYEFYGRSYSF